MITCVKFLQNKTNPQTRTKHVNSSILLFTSSRDRRVKMWRLQYEYTPIKNFNITLEQTIEGHVHSVWDVDCTAEYLVAGSADKTIRVWRNSICTEDHSTLGKKFNDPKYSYISDGP